ncbi:MAG TPA: N-acetylglucosamine-6-phosphate deacetylase [Atribacteraceae bacterium]|nr:N-acetylglucosamine-6-phosphate deacetylase [Atribacteraceae bacterium]
MKARNITGNIVTPYRVISQGTLFLRGDRIERVCGPGEELPKGECFAFPGHFLFPGLIDLHIHGVLGEDSTDGRADGLEIIRSYLMTCGVTTFLPTTMSERREAVLGAFRTLREVLDSKTKGPRLPGLHLEGPYLSMNRRGAHNPQYLRNPDWGEIDDFFKEGESLFARMTIAPELPGALEAIDVLTRRGVLISLGHTEADYQTSQKAFYRGARLVTHVFNAMDPLHHRQANFLSFALGFPEIAVELIADGVHVVREVMQLVLKLKNQDNLVLVSDAVRAAGLGDGDYTLGGQAMKVSGGIARIPFTDSLAGSTTSLNQMLRGIREAFDVSFPDLARMGSLVPARLLGIDDRFGGLERGKVADIAVFDKDFHCQAVFLGGEPLYLRSNTDSRVPSEKNR